MRTTSFARALVAACYAAIYAGCLAVAWQGRHGVGGGMAFTAPAVLGVPWSPLVLAALMAAGVKPEPDGPSALLFIALFVVPPTLNVLVILFAGRRRRPPDDAT